MPSHALQGDRCFGSSYFLSLVRIDGTWKIMNKTFEYTGGEPPAA